MIDYKIKYIYLLEKNQKKLLYNNKNKTHDEIH
jgi:hypothetical protein